VINNPISKLKKIIVVI